MGESLRITLVGYGQMGKAIEAVAQQRGHRIAHRIGSKNAAEVARVTPATTDVAIEFSIPATALSNYQTLIKNGVPVVTGTTAWGEPEALKDLLAKHKGAFLHAPNFSVGVNLLFRLNALLAQWMNIHPQYDVFLEERHHRRKKDSPGGTARRLAEDAIAHLDRKTAWVLNDALRDRAPKPEELTVGVVRAGEIPGTHRMVYTSGVDELEIKHQAFGRQGFALGAVLAAEWLAAAAKRGETGIFSFDTVLDQPPG